VNPFDQRMWDLFIDTAVEAGLRYARGERVRSIVIDLTDQSVVV
jgi:hypothetical protein